MSGRYVALEGIEGAGKSTVAAVVARHLEERGCRVLTVREPGGTGAGESIRRILLDPDTDLAPWPEALLFAAARAQLARDVVGPALAAGTWVVSDRTVYSSLAYQGGARGLGIESVRDVNAPGLGEVWPHLVVLLRLDPDTGLARQRVVDRIGGEGRDFQAAVAAAYDELARAEPDRFVTVDAGRPLETVVADVFDLLEQRWGPCSRA